MKVINVTNSYETVTRQKRDSSNDLHQRMPCWRQFYPDHNLPADIDTSQVKPNEWPKVNAAPVADCQQNRQFHLKILYHPYCVTKYRHDINREPVPTSRKFHTCNHDTPIDRHIAIYVGDFTSVGAHCTAPIFSWSIWEIQSVNLFHRSADPTIQPIRSQFQYSPLES